MEPTLQPLLPPLQQSRPVQGRPRPLIGRLASPTQGQAVDWLTCVQAEEAQRKLRRQNGEDTGEPTWSHDLLPSCRATIDQPDCVCVCMYAALPPPVPPSLSPLFGSLINLLQCDVLLAVEGAVLQWAMEPSGGGWTESMLQRVRLEW